MERGWFPRAVPVIRRSDDRHCCPGSSSPLRSVRSFRFAPHFLRTRSRGAFWVPREFSFWGRFATLWIRRRDVSRGFLTHDPRLTSRRQDIERFELL